MPDPRTATRRQGGRRRGRAVAIVLLVALAGLLVAVAPSGASAAACPTTGGTPITSQLSNGTLKIGPVARASGTSGSGCGLLIIDDQGIRTVLPKDNLTFDPFTLHVGILSVPTTVTAVSDFGGPVELLPNNQVGASLTGSVTSTASILGFKCTIGPFTPTLTTGTSGALTGTPFTGQPDGSLGGKLVANDFAVPAVRPSARCPLPIAALVNLTTHLPQKAGGSSITYDASLRVG
ncbi:MAG TPA: hypothetical protein VF486_04670 [Actinomycetes bacterium]